MSDSECWPYHIKGYLHWVYTDERLSNPVRKQTNTYLSTSSLLISILIWWRGLGFSRNNMEKSGTIPIGTKFATNRATLKNRFQNRIFKVIFWYYYQGLTSMLAWGPRDSDIFVRVNLQEKFWYRFFKRCWKFQCKPKPSWRSSNFMSDSECWTYYIKRYLHWVYTYECLSNPVRKQTNTYLSTSSLLISILIWWRSLGFSRNNMEKCWRIPKGTKSWTNRATLKKQEFKMVYDRLRSETITWAWQQ